MSSLRTVRIPPAAISDEVLAVLGRLPKLRALDLGKSPISDRGLQHLAALRSLETLDLSGTPATDRGLVYLAGLTNLTQLRLPQTRITSLGLSHLGRLAKLQHLDLSGTAVDDAGLSRLAGLRQLQSLQLLDTQIRGPGLAHLRGCRGLVQVSLPPLPAGAVASVNTVKSWQNLTLKLAAPDAASPARAAERVAIDAMPELSRLEIASREPLETIRVAGCPRLASLTVTHDMVAHAGAALQLSNLPDLRALQVKGVFREFAGKAELERIQYLAVSGVLTSSAVRALSGCRALERLELTLTGTAGDPIPIAELAELSRVEYAQVVLGTAEASWGLRLVGKMPALKKLYLRGRDLTARDLAPLANCRKLTEIYVHGIDDSGEPLAFLDSLPDLDQCLVLGCPRVGKVRLTAETGVRRFYFKYGQLDELEIDGARKLTEVYLGHKAFGYNDDDARFPRLGQAGHRRRLGSASSRLSVWVGQISRNALASGFCGETAG